jgi:HPt (histidine-containing phosphotransfer) domain-containing protein
MAAFALLALVTRPYVSRRRHRAWAQASPVRDQAPAATSALRLDPLAGGAFLAERFETRRRSAGQRLLTLLRGLRRADPLTARALLAEAEGIAHLLAGTAGMFGEADLANVARRAEAEIRAAQRADGKPDPRPAIERLIAALDASAQRPDSDERLRA